jgi:hypothetical protein
MRSFYIYAGGSGKKILKCVVERYNDPSWSEWALNQCRHFMMIDAQDPSVQIENIYGNKLLHLQRLSGPARLTEGTGSGVGMLWPNIVDPASIFFDEKFKKDEKLAILFSNSEHFHICHSGGGGTGCGSGPVFSEKLRQFNEEANETTQYITASIVLPEAKEEFLRVPNACSTIGLHSKYCNGIFIYDLSHDQQVWQKNGPILPTNHIGTYWFTDYAIAEADLMLTSLNDETNTVFQEKIYEAADLGTLCIGPRGACSLIAPCYAEYSADLLKDLSLEVLIRDLITNRSAVEFALDKPLTRLIIFCVLPAPTFTNDLNGIIEKTKSKLPELLKEILPEMEEEGVIYFYLNKNLERILPNNVGRRPEKIKSLKMLALIINPFMPRLYEMENEFEEKLKGWNIGEHKDAYEKAFVVYKSCLKKIYQDPAKKKGRKKDLP